MRKHSQYPFKMSILDISNFCVIYAAHITQFWQTLKERYQVVTFVTYLTF